MTLSKNQAAYSLRVRQHHEGNGIPICQDAKNLAVVLPN